MCRQSGLMPGSGMEIDGIQERREGERERYKVRLAVEADAVIVVHGHSRTNPIYISKVQTPMDGHR